MHNVQGFNSPHKRKKAFTTYKKTEAQIVLIQETHFASNNHLTFFHRSYKQAFFTLYPTKCRGVALLLHNIFPLEVQHVYKDPDSRFLIPKGSIAGWEITISNVYAPNVAQASFFATFFKILERYPSTHVFQRRF